MVALLRLGVTSRQQSSSLLLGCYATSCSARRRFAQQRRRIGSSTSSSSNSSISTGGGGTHGGTTADRREQAAAFQGVFTAETSAELAAAYDTWAGTYDDTIAHELSGTGENTVTVECVRVLSELVPAAGVKSVLDCGAGTGAAGPLLMQLYPDVSRLIAFDLSAGMLREASRRGCYTATIQGCCPDMTDAAKAGDDGFYDLVFCAGTFTPNHAPPSTLAELVDLTRPGGHIMFSVRSYFYEDLSSGFKIAVEGLEAAGQWQLVECRERDYLPKEDVMALYFLYRRTC